MPPGCAPQARAAGALASRRHLAPGGAYGRPRKVWLPPAEPGRGRRRPRLPGFLGATAGELGLATAAFSLFLLTS